MNLDVAVGVDHPLPRVLDPADADEYTPFRQARLEAARVDRLRGIRVDDLGLLSRHGRVLHQSFGRELDAESARRDRRFRLRYLAHAQLSPRRRRVSEAIWVVDNLSPGYFHWLTECLPRLLVAVHEAGSPQLLLLPGSFAGDAFVAETLAAFPTVRVEYLARCSSALIETLWLPRRIGPAGRYRPDLLAALRELLETALCSTGPQEKTLLHISRDRTDRRRIVNESELVDALAGRGFTTIYPETLTVSEQIEYARSASVIIGAHGGGLTNMMFMRPGASVIELRRGRGQWGFECFFTLAGACGLAYDYVMCDSGPVSGSYFHNDDLVADVGQVEAVVDRVLEGDLA